MVKLLKTYFVNLKLKAPSLSDCLEINLCVEDLLLKGSLKNVGRIYVPTGYMYSSQQHEAF